MKQHSIIAKLQLILPLLIIFICAFGFLFAPNDPDLVDMTIKFLPPCAEYPLGTDNLGRCVLSRLLYGGQTTLGIVLVGSVTVSRLPLPANKSRTRKPLHTTPREESMEKM